jgi:predicted site-specific integrase-resolvase
MKRYTKLEEYMVEMADADRLCGIYVRVSTAQQAEEGESLREQTENCEDYCRGRKWKVVKVYREEGFSAKDENRPAYRRMIEDIKKEKRICLPQNGCPGKSLGKDNVE